MRQILVSGGTTRIGHYLLQRLENLPESRVTATRDFGYSLREFRPGRDDLVPSARASPPR